MCAKTWDNTDYPLRVERRERQRVASLIEGFFTTTYNTLRQHMPEMMVETPDFRAINNS